MKNLVFKIILCLVIFIITLICTIKLFDFNRNYEIPALPEIEQTQKEEIQTTQGTEPQIKIENTAIKSKKINKKIPAQEKSKTTNINTEEENIKNTLQEEEDMLKKVPPAKEVIVDKEIKVKSSGKYIFK